MDVAITTMLQRIEALRIRQRHERKTGNLDAELRTIREIRRLVSKVTRLAERQLRELKPLVPDRPRSGCVRFFLGEN